mmetsp:Transcript_32150/g.100340  ORF Transcript_32150/g.100340 Transcript_32150/m.100340 type:complete len:203 (+) Transcript_32150:214-822(+)
MHLEAQQHDLQHGLLRSRSRREVQTEVGVHDEDVRQELAHLRGELLLLRVAVQVLLECIQVVGDHVDAVRRANAQVRLSQLCQQFLLLQRTRAIAVERGLDAREPARPPDDLVEEPPVLRFLLQCGEAQQHHMLYPRPLELAPRVAHEVEETPDEGPGARGRGDRQERLQEPWELPATAGGGGHGFQRWAGRRPPGQGTRLP